MSDFAQSYSLPMVHMQLRHRKEIPLTSGTTLQNPTVDVSPNNCNRCIEWIFEDIHLNIRRIDTEFVIE